MKFAAGFAVVALGAQGLRRKSGKTQTKFILGDIPILNYDSAAASLVESSMEAEENWVVVMKPEVTDDQIHALCSLGSCLAQGQPEQGGVPYFQVRASERKLAALLSRSQASVEFVEPDGRVELEPEAAGSLAAEGVADTTWGLTRIGTSQRSSRGAGTHIYILDTGIRRTHSEFGGRVIPTLDKTASRFRQKCASSSPTCAGDTNGHGTHCAGTAGGASYGVASAASLYAMKVLDDDGEGEYSWSYDALNFIATKGKRPAVASISHSNRAKLEAYKKAVDAAVNAGVVIVVSGGSMNMEASRYSPAFVPNAITVGSTTSQDHKSKFSNYGECVNIWAPGSDILSAGATSDDASDTISGTAMACSYVSGAAALLLEKDPNMNSAKVLAKLQANAVRGALPLWTRNNTSWGIEGLRSDDINALLYVGAGGPPPTPVPTPAPTRSTCDEATSERRGNICWCKGDLICYEGDRRRCQIRPGSWIYNQHRVDCPECACVPDPEK